MDAKLKFGAAVVYVDDLEMVVEFYSEAFDLHPRFYDRDAGFAEIGPDGYLAIAAHRAGELMMPGAYTRDDGPVSGVEVAFYTESVAEAYERALRAGATALTSPRLMPWGQTVAYVRSIEGTIVGFVTPLPPASQPAT